MHYPCNRTISCSTIWLVKNLNLLFLKVIYFKSGLQMIMKNLSVQILNLFGIIYQEEMYKLHESHIFYLPIKNINCLGKKNSALLIKTAMPRKFQRINISMFASTYKKSIITNSLIYVFLKCWGGGFGGCFFLGFFVFTQTGLSKYKCLRNADVKIVTQDLLAP